MQVLLESLKTHLRNNYVYSAIRSVCPCVCVRAREGASVCLCLCVCV
jgi:hypothetical protein